MMKILKQQKDLTAGENHGNKDRSIVRLHSEIRSHLLLTWIFFIVSIILTMTMFVWFNIKQMNDTLITWRGFFDRRIQVAEKIIGGRGRNSSPLQISDYRISALDVIIQNIENNAGVKIDPDSLGNRLRSLGNNEIYIIQMTNQSDGSKNVYYIQRIGSRYSFISFRPEDYLSEITSGNWIIRLEYDGNILYSTVPNETATKNIPAFVSLKNFNCYITFNTALREAPATRLYLTHDISLEFYSFIFILAILSLIFYRVFLRSRRLRYDIMILQNEEKELRELMNELASSETIKGDNLSSSLDRLKIMLARFPEKLDKLRVAFNESIISRETMRLYITNMSSMIDEVIKDTQTIRGSEERYRNMIDAIPDNVWEIDPSGNVLFSSRHIIQMLGYSPEEITGRSFINLVENTDRESVENKYRDLVTRNASIQNVVLRFRHSTGHLVILESNGYPFTNQDGSLAGYRFVSRDISERIRHEEEKQSMEKHLVQAQKMEAVGTLAGGIAHDFNNILAGVIGSLEILSLHIEKNSEPEPAYVRKFVDVAYKSSKKAVSLVRQLLNISRRHRVVMQVINLRESVESVVMLCRNSFPKSVNVKFLAVDEEFNVMADPVQIEQILLNLCINASHAMTIMRGVDEPEGGDLAISIEKVYSDETFANICQNSEPGAVFFRVNITDNGVGMSSETLQHIFEPFYTTKENETGTGLGLFMVYNLVKENGGFINVVSETGEGTTFYVFLPEYKSPAAGDEAYRNVITKGTGKILIIDDEESILLVEENILSGMGFSIIPAHGPEEGIEKFTENSETIDAVLLDISMPGKSGLDLCRIFRSINPDIGILFTSGIPEDERIKKAQRAGIDGFIMKPFDTGELGRKLNEIIRMKMQIRKSAILKKEK